MQVFRLFSLVTAILALATSLAGAAERAERGITVDNRARSYVVYAPEDVSGPLRVLFGLHPGFGTAAWFEQRFDLLTHPEAGNFLIVYPNGYGRSWNAGGCCGPAFDESVDDVAFIDAIFADLEQLYTLSPDQNVVVGFSNGGAMGLNLACKMNDRIQTVVVMGGTRDNAAPCEMTRPVSILFLHGEEDEFSPLEGGMGKLEKPGPRPSIPDNVAFWSEANQCTKKRFTSRMRVVSCDRYVGCADDAVVELCVIPRLGHWAPGQKAFSPEGTKTFGPQRDDLDGINAVFDFITKAATGR